MTYTLHASSVIPLLSENHTTELKPNETDDKTTRNEIFIYVSYIGWGLSISSLVVTVATYLILRSLRSKTKGRLLICLSLSLLCLYIVFLTGVRRSSAAIQKDSSINHPVVCNAVAALLHYFTLTSVAWMSVESFAVYRWVVRLRKSQGVRFFTVSCLVAWGLPLLVVGGIEVIDHEQYEGTNKSKLCFMDTPKNSSDTLETWAFVFCNLTLIFIVLSCNFIFLAFVSKELVFGRNFAPRYGDRDHDKQRKAAIYRTVNDLVMSVLLGLTWIFGTVFMYYDGNNLDISYAFGILFCLCYFLQGFLVFLLFCVRLEEVRNVWKLWFYKLYDWIKYIREPLYVLLFIGIMYLTLDILRIGEIFDAENHV